MVRIVSDSGEKQRLEGAELVEGGVRQVDALDRRTLRSGDLDLLD
jgi:hypothetical protein